MKKNEFRWDETHQTSKCSNVSDWSGCYNDDNGVHCPLAFGGCGTGCVLGHLEEMLKEVRQYDNNHK